MTAYCRQVGRPGYSVPASSRNPVPGGSGLDQAGGFHVQHAEFWTLGPLAHCTESVPLEEDIFSRKEQSTQKVQGVSLRALGGPLLVE